ncbi:hypothetical protein HDV03_001712 [Kappamyces sp. JEL0829]|nr:hypothetical protein HDV03_001712 [Kappamyces sp. JEL0829]
MNLANTPVATIRTTLDTLQQLRQRQTLASPAAKWANKYLDIGCGDGRWVIEMAQWDSVALCVGIDLDPHKIELARVNAQEAGVASKCLFLLQDFVAFDLTPFDIMTAYITKEAMRRLSKSFLDRIGRGQVLLACVLYQPVGLDFARVEHDKTYQVTYYQTD